MVLFCRQQEDEALDVSPIGSCSYCFGQKVMFLGSLL